jgi:asparagine synthetase B (glutamine-hydrolysing)
VWHCRHPEKWKYRHFAGTVRKMTADVSHRGPDDEGIVFLSVSSRGDLQPCCETDDKWKVALGSRRLSILDLSPQGICQ